MPFGQHVLVLIGIVGRDSEQRLVGCKWGNVVIAGAVACWWRGDTAGPCRDRAIGIAGADGTGWRQCVAEIGFGVVGVSRIDGMDGQSGQSEPKAQRNSSS